MAQRLCLGCMEKIKDEYKECPYCGYVDGTPAREAYHIAPGNVLSGRYIVGRVVGYGGFGVTYIGYDGLLEKKIAIKEYLPSEFATRMPGQTEVTVYSGERQEQYYSGIDKFVEEAKRLAQFKEVPGVVRIFDSFTENKTAYIIMEYLEGETLKSRLEREGKLGVDVALNIMMPILTALKEVHKIGIIHRDIAPDNIFLTKKGEVKLLDFGAARYATTTHSKSLSVIIKQGYAPEEQYRSKGDQGPWTDVYACGATLYKMLTGITPEDSMERAGKDTLVPPSKKGAKTSKNLDTAIMNAMNIRIEDRTQSAEEFEAELISEVEVKRKKAHDRKMDIGKWPIGVKIGAGAVACGLITFGVLLATNVIHFDMKQIIDTGLLASNEVYVPNLVNYSVNEAETKTLDYNLILQIVDKQNSDVIPKDKILSQNITDGEVVEVGTTVEVAVSAGGEIVYIDELEGLTQEDAIAQLEALGLSVEIIEEDSDIAPGCVIRYEADSAEENTDISEGIEKGSTIKLYISKGRSDIDENEDTQVPQVVGLTYTDATALASNAKLYIYRIRGEYSTSIPKGQIIEQNLAAGSTVKQGSSLGVVVSLGIQTTRVPDVQYKDINTAAGLLSQNNLTYEYQYEDSSTVAKDHVIRQSIAAGTEVEMQTKIVLYISKGNPNAGNSSVIVADNTTEQNDDSGQNASTNTTPSTEQNITTEEEKVSVPDLKGCTEAEARKKLEAVGLVLGSVTKKEQDDGTDGIVFEQGITKNSKVTKGTAVSVSICDNSGKKVTVPNVVGKSQADAEMALKQSNLNLVVLGYRNDGGVSANGTVLVQEHIGENVSKKTDIGVYLCDNTMHTEYRSRTRTKTTQSTTSSSSTLAGWTLVDTTSSWGSYGSWSSWSDTSISSSESREVQTQQVVSTPAKTQYKYYAYYCLTCKYWTRPCNDTGTYCPNCGRNTDWDYTYDILDYQLTSIGQSAFDCTYHPAINYTVNGNRRYYEGTVVTPAIYKTQYRYRTRSLVYTYYFEREVYSEWTEWSEWSVNQVAGSDTREVDICQIYNYPSY